MTSKSSDKDEVALLMQQQGLSRVQATKLLYEMTKQRKKEEAAAAAGIARPISPTVVPLQDESLVRKQVERYSSLKDFAVPAPSQIHDDIDLTAPRPKLRAEPSFRAGTDGKSAVNLMAATIEASAVVTPRMAKKKSTREEDIDDTEEVAPFDEDKFSEELAATADLSPATSASSGNPSQPARRRSSNSALNLRPLARLHPAKFGDGAAALTAFDSDLDMRVEDADYQSGNSSDAEAWEEPEPQPEPPRASPAASVATRSAAESPVLRPANAVNSGSASRLVPPNGAVTAKLSASNLTAPPKPAPGTLRPPESPRGISPTPSSQSLASKLYPPVVDTTPPEPSAQQDAGARTPSLSAPPTAVPVYAKRSQLSTEDLDAETDSGKSSHSAPTGTVTRPSVTGTTATTSSESYNKTESSETKSSTTRTVTSNSGMLSPPPAPSVAPQQLGLDERMALLNSVKPRVGSSVLVSSPVPIKPSGPAGLQSTAAAVDPNALSVSEANATASAGASAGGAAARASEVLNVKVGNKKLTVRASFTTGGGSGANLPPTLAAATAAAAAQESLPPPPPYTASPATSVEAAAPPPAYESPVTPKPVPPVANTTRPMPSLPTSPPKPSVAASGPESVKTEASAATTTSSLSPMGRRDSGNSAEFTALSDVEEGSEEDEGTGGETHEERVTAIMTKYRRRSRMKRDSLPGALKNLDPIDEAEIGRLMHQEQVEREAAAAAKSGQFQVKPTNGHTLNGTSDAVASSASVASTTSQELQRRHMQKQRSLEQDKPVPIEVAAVLNKASTDLIEELIAQGYNRENAIELAKEIELDRRGERHHPRHAAPYVEGSPMHRNAAPAVHAHSRGANPSQHFGFRERQSFDRERGSFPEDDTSVISNISGASRASSYCESDKLLMNLLLSQQKGKYGVNMYESLTNQDEPAIERYMASGCTLDQAVLKVFEKKYGAVDNQMLPKSIYGNVNPTAAGKLALNGDDPLEIVDTMHAEIELLMLSSGVTRDVAVKMLLSKVAKERALQQQGGGGGLFNIGGIAENEHHLHRAASMGSMLPNQHLHGEVDGGRGYAASHAHSSNTHTHTLHATKSMYGMPTSGASVSGGSVTGGSVAGGSVTSGGGRARKSESAYANQYPNEAGFPTQYPSQYPPHHHGNGYDGRHGGSRRPSYGDDWAQSRHGSGASVTSAHSGAGRVSVRSGASDSRTQDDREYIPALLREQEAMFGVNMYDYLPPDDPEVARLMAEFGFSRTDAMIAVFQQFPPPVLAASARRDSREQMQYRDMRGGYPGSRPPPGPAETRPSPASIPPASSSSYPARNGNSNTPPTSAVSPEEDELQRAIRLSMLEAEGYSRPGAVAVPGVGNGRSGPPPSNVHPPPAAGGGGGAYRPPSNLDVTTLMQMGFSSAQAHDALRRCNNDVNQAVNFLVGGH